MQMYVHIVVNIIISFFLSLAAPGMFEICATCLLSLCIPNSVHRILSLAGPNTCNKIFGKEILHSHNEYIVGNFIYHPRGI